MPEMKMNGAVSAVSKVFVTFLTIAMLAAGVFLAARYGDFSMRSGAMHRMPLNEMPMEEMQH